jgi:hypothetical protein
MTRRRLPLTAGPLSAVLALLLSSPFAVAAPPDAKTFHVVLSGLAEEPENLHRNADRGFAEVTFDRSDAEVCWQVLRLRLTAGEALPHAGHIHFGPPNVAGPIVVHFFGTGGAGPAPTSYPTERVCRSIDPVLLDQILANPGQYYVNLHNTTHPSGVVRGQLRGGHGG